MKTDLNFLNVLTTDEQQLLKDTIKYGAWGSADYEFLDDNGNIETVSMYGYCTNDAKKGGHFIGLKISQMFRSIYKKLCKERRNNIGQFISHCNDWWGDGTGDMLFVRFEIVDKIVEWAKSVEKYIPKDKEFVWAWNEISKTDNQCSMVAGFYDAENNCLFNSSGQRNGFKFSHYAAFDGTEPKWACEAFEQLEK